MWQDKANCLTTPDPSIFFSAKKRDKATAVALCAECVVKSECLAFAIAMQSVDGIYGGTTGDERRRMLVEV